MGIRSVASKPLAKWVVERQQNLDVSACGSSTTVASEVDRRWPSYGILAGIITFRDVHTIEEFRQAVPVRDYEDLKPYIEQILAGDSDVLWKGKPLYFAKTSGTTSGTKYIPITQDSIPNHIDSARDALLNYINETGNSAFLDKKTYFPIGQPGVDPESGHQHWPAIGHCQPPRTGLSAHEPTSQLRNECY